jgi:uncharacterized Zn finger protein
MHDDPDIQTRAEPMNGWRQRRTPSVLQRAQRAARAAERLAKSRGKQGRALSPVRIDGRVISRSFWGKAWCANLESYRDYEYRLPRGRSYVRSGAVLDLQIEPGRIDAVVAGSRAQPYEVQIKITPLAATHWSRLKMRCAGEIGSLIELLEGRLSDRVMGIVTDPAQGLFPKPQDIRMSCSCPDWATMCKHVAAVLYGVGARLDAEPQLLFTLRNLEHAELIAAAVDLEVAPVKSQRKTIAAEDLSGVFGIELADAPRAPTARKPRPAAEAKPLAKRRPARTPTPRSGTVKRKVGGSRGKGNTQR